VEPPPPVVPDTADPFVVGTFGGLGPERRVASVVAAFARLRHDVRNAELLLVGQPAPDVDLPALLAAEGVADAAKVTGRVPLAEFEALMAAAHVCVQLRNPTT